MFEGDAGAIGEPLSVPGGVIGHVLGKVRRRRLEAEWIEDRRGDVLLVAGSGDRLDDLSGDRVGEVGVLQVLVGGVDGWARGDLADDLSQVGEAVVSPVSGVAVPQQTARVGE